MLLVKFILKPWTLDLVSTKNFLSFLKHAKQNHGALVWVTWSLVCLVSSLKLICDLFWDCICLEVGSWTGWCGVIKIKLSKQNLKISVLELTSLFLSFHINRLSPDLHPPHHVVRTNAVAFSAHSHQTFSSHACCSALCTLSLTVVSSKLVLPFTSFPGLHLVVSLCRSTFCQLKVNMEHDGFVVKGLIMPCMFIFCVEVELVRLIFKVLWLVYCIK